jgi:Cu/Zn superoxide dismutase
VKRITKAALGGLAGGALILAGTQAAVGETSATTYTFSEPLTDLNKDPLTGASPFDGAAASLKIVESNLGTSYRLRVTGIDLELVSEEERQTFGSHLHTGPCQENNPSGAGGHYTHEGDFASLRQAEAWFDLVPDADGVAVDQTWSWFVPADDGIKSLVIHALPTNEVTGSAGARQVCLPLSGLSS